MDTTPRTRPRRGLLLDAGMLLVAGAALHGGYALATGQPFLWDPAFNAVVDTVERTTLGDDVAEGATDPSPAPPPSSGTADEGDGASTSSAETDTSVGPDDSEVPAPAEETPAAGHAAEVGHAVEILTRHDDGTRYPAAARWEQATIRVHLSGDAVTDAVSGDVDEVLRWLNAATGKQWQRTSERAAADVVMDASAGALPRATQTISGRQIVSARGSWDPTYQRWGTRWMWEELVHTAGPLGDHGPAGTLFNDDMVANGATQFDRWLVEGLYQADDLSPGGLRAWFESNPRS